MDTSTVALAVDLGASSGRVVAGEFNGETLKIGEVHRFPTRNVRLGFSCHWDVLYIFDEILKGLSTAIAHYGAKVKSIGVDTWGVDYALLDRDGKMLGNPHQYRDPRTDGMRELAASRFGEAELFAVTGVQPMFFNTLYQLMSEAEAKSPALEVASKLLFMPDLINFWLSGVAVNERTIASTSQMLDARSKDWARDPLRKLGIPTKMLGEVVEPGSILGPLSKRVAIEVRALEGAVPSVVAVGSHDTASAVVGRPAGHGRRAFLSSGTWSLLGVELESPVLSAEALEEGFSNEMGVGGKVRFLTNICGLWLLQECRAQWIADGENVTFGEMAKMAEEATPFLSVIDPNNPSFAKSGDMPNKIRKYCADTGQVVPETKGEILRVATESLAACYRLVWDGMQSFAREPLQSVSVVGGGCQNELLNQCTASSLGVPVEAGPVEATAMGNIITQLVATGSLDSIALGQELVRRSIETKKFTPRDSSLWSEYVDRLRSLVETHEPQKA
ncbi:rhamnulokinase [Pelagicoccus enzymogenes]|uniref:rhamnulokinase n=1 Tax=Pelagicoccus enzymogenes TaxID=2773457 RepID=UPI00280FB163|nr:rhamnulokinase family protein [Pelagicoccus enzymogenes]MDQ8197899.1 rhamnulokinase [Pelagicoccus enzymogenes]